MNKAYNFRLYPTKEQEQLFAKTFGCVRFVYNKMLGERMELYERFKDDEAKLKKYKSPTPAKYKAEFVWLKEVDSLALANAQMNLQTAYNNFFRDKRIGFPKFKAKHRDKNSYTTNNVNNNIRLEEKKIKLPKLGFVKLKQHRYLPSNQIIKSCNISKSSSGNYYVSILVEFFQEVQPISPARENVLGLDFEMKTLYTDSQCVRAEYPRFYRKALEKLAREQRKLAKCTKGSNNRGKQRIKVAKVHEKVANCRRDFLHKRSRELVDSYDAIVIEDLNMKTMSQCLNFGKSVNDNAWGMFTTFLKYKLENEGKLLVKVDKWFPSSKACHYCGEINKELELSDKEWTCSSCGCTIDRDYNASKNIRDEGLRLLALIA
ncbi:RNA-guided endonuclease TnpB family protein [Desulfosporosinus nitroreducens]|uniref:Transposase n=1 Tax=Desulfosporosinus nitroreducens TaxID=2018668 RepID=A0ABT8QV22_9FIRM|nr:RNA-guided endonuclease TnpB family protein [Desulfosporosinus nitroreducens]MDO0825201.1 transposase [Desulfosporosinus nitroreducens]